MRISKFFAITAGVAMMLTSSITQAKDTIHAQLDELAEMAKGKRLGILTNGSARTVDGTLDVDYLLDNSETTVSAFFGPEHGFRGDLADGQKTGDGIDEKTSVPVYSLYGKRQSPTPEQLKDVDLFVFDIPDVGVRFYTYVWTMTLSMEACAKAGIPYVVIDRPNPINGTTVAGAVNTKDLGLVGRLGHNAEFGVATRHGLTAGELATLWNEEWMEPKVELSVIKTSNWKRDQWWDESGRTFIPTSPNMRTLDCATVYPGTCIFEGTNLNEGRGTPKPFEMMGAPFVDGKAWADALNARNLPGVTFEPITFTPDSRRFKGEQCGGVTVKVTDRNNLKAVEMGIHMLQTVAQLYPDQVKITDYADRLMATPELRTRILTEDVDSIVESWQPGLEKFKALRAKHLLYPPPAGVGNMWQQQDAEAL